MLHSSRLKVMGYGGSGAAGYRLMRYARLKVRGYGLKVMGAAELRVMGYGGSGAAG